MEEIRDPAESPPSPGGPRPDGAEGEGSFLGWVEEVRLSQSAEAGAPASGSARKAGRPGPSRLLLAVLACGLAAGPIVLGLGVARRSPPPQTLLRGRVVDARGKPSYGAVVTLEAAPELVARTAADGSFRLAGAPPGSRDLLVAVGIVAQEYRVEIRDGDVTEIGTLCYAAPPSR